MSRTIPPDMVRRMCKDIRALRARAKIISPPGEAYVCERGGLATLLVLLVDDMAGPEAAERVRCALDTPPTAEEMAAEMPAAEMLIRQMATGAAPAPKGLQ